MIGSKSGRIPRRRQKLQRFTPLDFVIYVSILIFSLFSVSLPFFLILIVSFTDEASIVKNGYSFFFLKHSVSRPIPWYLKTEAPYFKAMEFLY